MFASYERSRTRSWVGIVLGTVATVFTFALAFGAEQSLRNDALPEVNPGKVVVDPAVQEIAENAIKKAIQAENAESGFAIVTEPSTGRVLAVASVDPTGKHKGDWALGQVFEPASLAKTLVIAQAIDKGLTEPSATHSCENGSYRYGSHVYHDWKQTGWDHLTTEETITNSSDICSIKVGELLGEEGLQTMLWDFGFGPEGTAKSFPEARTGPTDPLIVPEDLDVVPAISAGYGFRTSPLELVQAYGAIANGGNLLKPRAANDSAQPFVIRRVLSNESAAKVREILRQVVIKGTAKGRASSDLYSTAGKTATSYFPDLTKWELIQREKKGNVAGFIGFAPVNDPRVEVYVGINDPKSDKLGGAHGSMHAAPIFKQITEEVLKHMQVAPDKPQS